MPPLSLRLPDELGQRLDQEALREGVPRSEIARQAISDYLARREQERFMAELAGAARSLAENAEARREVEQLQEDSAPLDAESIEAGERTAGDAPATKTRWWK